MSVRAVSVEKVIGDLTVKITKVSKDDANSRLIAALKFLAGLAPVDPGYGQPAPGGGGGRPDNTLPGQGAGGGRPDNTLPGQGGKPDNTLPGGGAGGGEKPDNTLPGGGLKPDNTLPPGVDNTLPQRPAIDPGLKPDNTLPGGPEVDNSLPGFVANNAKEIAAAILKGTACDPAQPKK